MKILAPIRNKAFSAAATGATLAVAHAAVIQESSGSSSLSVEAKAVVSPSTKSAQPSAETTPRFHEIILEDEAEWNEVAQKRFLELARVHALGELTGKLAAEYEGLKLLRRTANPSRTFEQIRADVELHTAVNAAIAGLQQLIDHGTRVFKAEA